MPTDALRVPACQVESLNAIAVVIDGAEVGDMETVCSQVADILRTDWQRLMNVGFEQAKVRTGYIYILGCAEGFWKIGRTKNAFSRVSEISVAGPYPITITHLISVTDTLWAERHLHEMFAEQRTNGEWFKLPKEKSDWLCKLKSCEKTHPPNCTIRNRTKRIVQNDNKAERPRDLAYDAFCEGYLRKYEKPYEERQIDFIKLAELRKRLGDGVTLREWKIAVEHYFDTPLGRHTIVDLCQRYDTFCLYPLNEFGKPKENGNGTARESNSTRNARVRLESECLLSSREERRDDVQEFEPTGAIDGELVEPDEFTEGLASIRPH